MKIEQLRVDNLREGVFCARGKRLSEQMHNQLEAWLKGDQLRGQVARSDDGEVMGFVLYYPIEQAPLDVEGEGLYMVQCVLVKPEYQKQGVGRALVESALADARDRGAAGLAAQGFDGVKRGDTDYMPGSFFRHMGMSPGDSRGPGTLYYVGLSGKTKQPRYLDQRFEASGGEHRIRIDIFDCRRCYVGIHNRETVLEAVERMGSEKPEVKVHDQSTREAIVDKGMSSGVFVDGKLTFFRGPISEEDVMTAIEVASSARKRLIDR